MKKNTIAVLLFVILFSHNTQADEGMWMPFLIEQNMATMTEMGLELTQDDIYNINKSCIKDAIVAINNGSCTGEVISEKGLILTNHHCAYSDIQYHSTLEHDYLTNGFWAFSHEEELYNPGNTVSFLKRVEDVTSRVLLQVSDTLSEEEREGAIKNAISDIIDEETMGNGYNAIIESIYFGAKYYLFVYETFPDVRLVGAPPESIGRFGGDVDNWEWPRHTGDFSLLRVYSDSSGNPSEHSENNIPLKPDYFLPISLGGVEEDDFTFVMGYPGVTMRYITSFELMSIMEYENKPKSEIRGVKQDIWRKAMESDDEIRLKYSSKYRLSANDWKGWIYQNKAIKSNGVLKIKEDREKEFSEWIEGSDSLNNKYGNALSIVEQGVAEISDVKNAQSYLEETQIFGAELFLNVYLNAPDLLKALEIGNDDNIKVAVDKFEREMSSFYKNYDSDTDKKITKVLLKMFMENVSQEMYPSYIDTEITKKHKGDVDRYIDDLFEETIFNSEEKVKAFLQKPKKKKLAKDPAFIAAESIVSMYVGYFTIMEDYERKIQQGMSLYVEGLMSMNPDKKFYPDANSTMRLTYGKAGDFNSEDGVHYDYYTTLGGMMEKKNDSVPVFDIPDKLVDIFENKDYGKYGNEDSTMTVCFITDNDITGGNSGSPMLNSRGELIGTVFDGNIESMSGDVEYDSVLQKCITVDIRYVLLVIDKFAGASNIIEELNIINIPGREVPGVNSGMLEVEN